MNAIQNRDNNLKARLRECLRKFCLSPAGNLYFQGFKANFIGQILFLNFKNDSIFDCRGDKTTGTWEVQWLDQCSMGVDCERGHCCWTFFGRCCRGVEAQVECQCMPIVQGEFLAFCINYNWYKDFFLYQSWLIQIICSQRYFPWLSPTHRKLEIPPSSQWTDSPLLGELGWGRFDCVHSKRAEFPGFMQTWVLILTVLQQLHCALHM
jgi:hypothetical protein